MHETALRHGEILSWLENDDAPALELLFQKADAVRAANVGKAIHLRGLVEISSYCRRQCAYCGLRAGNTGLERYRMTADEMAKCGREIASLGLGTIVLQSGEDLSLTRRFISDIVTRLKAETGLAVTLSLGEREIEDYEAWRSAGADRYLLRFETSDRQLYQAIHPPIDGLLDDRLFLLKALRSLGYEIGSGVMIGIPGQTMSSLADDLLLFAELDLDMIGCGPFISHPQTPLGLRASAPARVSEVVPSALMALKVIALSRLLRPDANIPSTTALATIGGDEGRMRALRCGANVVMPNFTPTAYRSGYEIYPDKNCIAEVSANFLAGLAERFAAISREVGKGSGSRLRMPLA